jgi:peptide/nickel transport system substrate-binding protein
VAEMLAGGLDLIMNVPIDQANQLKAAPHLTVTSGGTMRIVFILFNAGENAQLPAIKDVRVRRAIAHSIDKEMMAKQLVGEGSQVIHSICYPSQFGCTDDGVPRYAYDPAKAKALLAEAGFKDGLELEFIGYRERPQTEAMVNFMRAVGIKANLKFMQYAAMRELHRAHKSAATHQTWGSYNLNDMSASTSAFFKGIDDDMTKDPEIIALLQKGDTSVDANVRKESYKKALQLIQERAYAVPLYALNTWWVMNKDLGFKPFADELPRFSEMRWK